MFISIEKHTLQFIKPAKTSRGEYLEKPSYLLKIQEGNLIGIGEASPLSDLSIDGKVDLESVVIPFIDRDLKNKDLHEFRENLHDYPSLVFAFECAIKKIKSQQSGDPFFINNPNTWIKNRFTEGKSSIKINGLVWMNTIDEMEKEAFSKIESGFDCIKLKVGALDFDAECRLLEKIRKKHSAFDVEIRLDANGAFLPGDALKQIKELSRFEIHSIEQPIKAGQWEWMNEICSKSSIDIALDEELIGIQYDKIKLLLERINPKYIILKPTLLGGFEISDTWIDWAQKKEIGWWSTSALEGNIGLSDIAQWASNHSIDKPQGLGTGSLFIKNFPSHNKLVGDQFFHLST